MANQGAGKFYKRLKASCCQWKVEPETDTEYLQQLSKWRMTDSQWEHALDDLVAHAEDGHLPPLPLIYTALKASQVSSVDRVNGGWCTFSLDGRRNVIRIKSVDGGWKELEHYLDMHPKGEPDKRPFGKRIWTENMIELKLPAGAEDVRYHPDNETFER